MSVSNPRRINRLLKSNTFKFVIGEEKEEFNLHKSLVSHHLKPLDRLMNGDLLEAKQGCAFLDEDVGTFSRFSQFLYTADYETPEPGKDAEDPNKISVICRPNVTKHNKFTGRSYIHVSNDPTVAAPTTAVNPQLVETVTNMSPDENFSEIVATHAVSSGWPESWADTEKGVTGRGGLNSSIWPFGHLV